MSGRSRIQSLPRADLAGSSEPTCDGRFEFAVLLRQHQTQLFGYIYSLVRDLDDADDLFQQTSLVLWEKFAQFDAARSFISWACGVARYEVLNFVRSHHRDRLYFSDELNLAMIEAQAALDDERLEERRDALSSCMRKLRERHGAARSLLPRVGDRTRRGARLGPVDAQRSQLAPPDPADVV